MKTPVQHIGLPFKEAIAYFKSKLNMPAEHWDTLMKEQHLKAFSAAGAVKADLIEDLRRAVDKSLSEGHGSAIKVFRQTFDEIVEKHGWGYKGGRNWRTRIMLNTNLKVAHHRGHWKQMNDPAVKKLRPYLRYVESSSRKQRPRHKRWVNTILPIDHKWWKTHYPPNGWGCTCSAVSMSEREKKRFLTEEKNSKFPPRTRPLNDGHYVWKDRHGKNHKIPNHIDPGWDYNVGMDAAARYSAGAPRIKNLKALDKYIEKDIADALGMNGKIKIDHSIVSKGAFASVNPKKGIIGFSDKTFKNHNSFRPRTDLYNGIRKLGDEKLTFNEEYAIESLFHEIQHIRQNQSGRRLKKESASNMMQEVVNQWTARRAYGLLTHKIAKCGPAHHKKIIEGGYGYRQQVRQLDVMITVLGIDDRKIAPEVVRMNYSHPRNSFIRKLSDILATGAEAKARKIKNLPRRIEMTLRQINNRDTYYKTLYMLLSG